MKAYGVVEVFALWGVESNLGPLGTSATEWPIVPTMGDYDNGEISGMKIGRGNRSKIGRASCRERV
jgi:hypothetical protein